MKNTNVIVNSNIASDIVRNFFEANNMQDLKDILGYSKFMFKEGMSTAQISLSRNRTYFLRRYKTCFLVENNGGVSVLVDRNSFIKLLQMIEEYINVWESKQSYIADILLSIYDIMEDLIVGSKVMIPTMAVA